MAPDHPTVSVVIPTYNRADLIGRAVGSLQAQTFPDWDCVVVDDGSTDDTAEVIEGIGDPRIRLVRHPANRGASAARNTGIEESQGAYVGFLDSDDEWLPEKLERQLAVFADDAEERIGAVVCGRILVDGDSARPYPGPDLKPSEAYRLFVTQGLGGLGAYGYLVRRSVFDAGIRFDESFPTCEDRDFLARIAASFELTSLPEPLMKQYRDGSATHLWSGMNAAVGLDRMIEKYHQDLTRWPSDLARLHRTAGFQFLSAGDSRSGRRHFAAALRIQPSHLSGYLWWVLSLLGSRAAARVQPRIARAAG